MILAPVGFFVTILLLDLWDPSWSYCNFIIIEILLCEASARRPQGLILLLHVAHVTDFGARKVLEFWEAEARRRKRKKESTIPSPPQTQTAVSSCLFLYHTKIESHHRGDPRLCLWLQFALYTLAPPRHAFCRSRLHVLLLAIKSSDDCDEVHECGDANHYH